MGYCGYDFGFGGNLSSRNGAPMVIGKAGTTFLFHLTFFILLARKFAHLDGDKPSRRIILPHWIMTGFNLETLEGVYDEQDPGNFEHMMLEIYDNLFLQLFVGAN